MSNYALTLKVLQKKKIYSQIKNEIEINAGFDEISLTFEK